MTFYNIVWLTVFILGGVALGVLGLANLEYFTILIINPRMVDEILTRTVNYYNGLVFYPIENAVVIYK